MWTHAAELGPGLGFPPPLPNLIPSWNWSSHPHGYQIFLASPTLLLQYFTLTHPSHLTSINGGAWLIWTAQEAFLLVLQLCMALMLPEHLLQMSLMAFWQLAPAEEVHHHCMAHVGLSHSYVHSATWMYIITLHLGNCSFQHQPWLRVAWKFNCSSPHSPLPATKKTPLKNKGWFYTWIGWAAP